MSKKILITGGTDGIGLETAKKLKKMGHQLIVHGRNADKLQKVSRELDVEVYRADFSNLSEVRAMANAVLEKHQSIDVLINNAGVFKTSKPRTEDGYDTRYMVNTFAPYLLSKKLLPTLKGGRIINLSSAAQACVNLDALLGKI